MPRELIGPSLERVKAVFYEKGRDVLMADSRVVKVQTGARLVRGGYRFVIKAFTGELNQMDRKGLRGQIDGIPVAYVTDNNYAPKSLPAFPDLDNKN